MGNTYDPGMAFVRLAVGTLVNCSQEVSQLIAVIGVQGKRPKLSRSREGMLPKQFKGW